jgi:hypothetical protein
LEIPPLRERLAFERELRELAPGRSGLRLPQFSRELYDEETEGAEEEPEALHQTPSAVGTNLGVSRRDLVAYDWAFKGKTGSEFKKAIESVAKEVDINPGLLAANLLAETRRGSYLQSGQVSSFEVGTDDFFEKRHDLSRKVPAYSKIGWDRSQTPITDVNEAGRAVKSIFFDSGRDAMLASAVYLKHGEVVLREAAARAGKNFDGLPIEARLMLIRLAFNAGHGRALRNLSDVLSGNEILITKPGKGPQRKATVRAAQAVHLSELIFGVPVR